MANDLKCPLQLLPTQLPCEAPLSPKKEVQPVSDDVISKTHRILFYRPVRACTSFLKKRPYWSQGIIGATLSLSGDLLAQVIANGGWTGLDRSRLLAFGLYGFTASGLFYVVYYNWLDNVVGPYLVDALKRQEPPILEKSACVIDYGTLEEGGASEARKRMLEMRRSFQLELKVAVGKTLIDNIFIEPFLLLFYFLAINTMLGASWTTIAEQLAHNFWTSYFIEAAVYIPFMVLSFRFIPPAWQPVIVNALGVAMTCALSLVQMDAL